MHIGNITQTVNSCRQERNCSWQNNTSETQTKNHVLLHCFTTISIWEIVLPHYQVMVLDILTRLNCNGHQTTMTFLWICLWIWWNIFIFNWYVCMSSCTQESTECTVLKVQCAVFYCIIRLLAFITTNRDSYFKTIPVVVLPVKTIWIDCTVGNMKKYQNIGTCNHHWKCN
jgi:hypothetical protein